MTAALAGATIATNTRKKTLMDCRMMDSIGQALGLLTLTGEGEKDATETLQEMR
ncbi:MAG: hypothetical protein JXA58_05205 [Dehalococcoidia bacterium]|nr:hypothetical protein [Dehalococcoidia bacterium]